jgi:endonuclease YncB( thermonuclease family)
MKIVIRGRRRRLMARPYPDDEEPPYDPWRGERPPRNWRWLTLLLGIVVGAAIVLLVKCVEAQEAGRYTQTKPVPLTLQRAEVRVIDGDTVVLNGKHIRLFGIDAPELGQSCADKWPAGQKAKGFLMILIEGRRVSCDDRGVDRYGRTLGVCRTGDDELNQAMVRTGNAWAYSRFSRDYVLDEIAARQARAGLWSHNCTPAWEWRHAKD